jgi:hypothetical protein
VHASNQAAKLVRQSVLTFDPEKRGIIDAAPIQSDRTEKNWMPVVLEDGENGEVLNLVYSVDPLVVVAYDKRSKKTEPPVLDIPELASVTRGGTQLIPWQDGWVSLVHQVHMVAMGDDPNGKKIPPKGVYVHRFVTFNRNVTEVTKIGGAFHFRHVGIEFAAGLATLGGRYFVSYGVNDRQAWLSEVSAETVQASLDGGLPAEALVPPVVAFSPARREVPAMVQPHWQRGGKPPPPIPEVAKGPPLPSAYEERTMLGDFAPPIKAIPVKDDE